FSTKLVIGIIVRLDGSPRPSGTGPIWKSSVTGAEAEAPAYYQAVLPDFAKASSGRPVLFSLSIGLRCQILKIVLELELELEWPEHLPPEPRCTLWPWVSQCHSQG